MRLRLRLLVKAAAASLALGSTLALAARPTPARAGAANGDKPARIVSLDLCANQLLIELVERERIAGVTHLAADPTYSSTWEKGKGLPVTRGAAEDVLGRRPDLILAGPFGVAPTVNLLRRLNMNVVVVPLVSDFEGVRAAVRTVAGAVGEAERGESMIEAFDHRLAAIAAPAQGPAPSAVVYQVGGAVSVAGGLADTVLGAAGFRNGAAAYRLTPGGQVPLELLAATPPDLFVMTPAASDYQTVLSDNLRHPALAALRQRHASIEVPSRYFLCGTPHIAEAVVRLAEVRAKIQATQR